MGIPEATFLAENQSVVAIVNQLHNYFKNCYSHYKTERSNLLSQLEATTGEGEDVIRQSLRDIDEELSIFGILSDSLSIADRVLHDRAVMTELGADSSIYKSRHYE